MSAPVELSHIHRFVPGTDAARAPILLLHGTGGDENDLLSLGAMVAPGAALLSPRGKVLEGGMPRFFRRLSEGVFDEADVRRRAGDLAAFVAAAREAYALPPLVALGFSNGANIAAALLLLHPEALAGAVLLRAMVPLQLSETKANAFRSGEPPRSESAPVQTPDADLADKPVLIVSGAADPIIPAENAGRLAALLRSRGATVSHETLPTGHGLTQNDVALAKAWLDARAAPPRQDLRRQD